jgi:hypothetical protein
VKNMPWGLLKEKTWVKQPKASYRLKVSTKSMLAHFYWDGKSCRKAMDAAIKKHGIRGVRFEYEVIGPLVTTTASPSKDRQRIRIIGVDGEC